MDKTIADLVIELNERYGQFIESRLGNFEKGEKGKVFIGILKNLFDIHGEHLGYSDFSDFKSDVVMAKNNLRKNKSKKIKKPKPAPKILKKEIPCPKKRFFRPNEGSGLIFTQYQIENLDLNPDSY